MGRRKGTYKRFVWCAALVQLPLALAVCLLNYLMDPMWCFPHAHRYNCVQHDIDDRQQKTNYLTFGGRKYDSLIIGNSRVKMMNQFDLGPRAYNYAVNGMTPREYDAYISYAKKVNGRPFDQILIGISFAMSNKQFEYPSGHEPSFYFNNANRPGYRYQLLLNGDVLCRSWSNFRHVLARDITVYFDRNTVEHVNRARVHLDNHLPLDLSDARDTYRSKYQYLQEFRSVLQTIKRHNPGSRIVIFTTPVSEPLYRAMVDEGRFEDYKRWLRDAVEVFGEVYHFEYLNGVTRNYHRHFIDGHHFDPETGTLMLHRIKGVPDPALPADFGMVLNKANFDEKLRQIEHDSLRHDKSGSASIR
jgi:hypothetical protein